MNLTWEILPHPPGRLMDKIAIWSLKSDGLELERLQWNQERSQYVDAQQIARGGNWNEAKSFCEARATKAASARRGTPLPAPAPAVSTRF